MTSPTQRTLQLLRKTGYTATVVERFNAHARIRQDLFGFADVLAIQEGRPILAVQATTVGNQSARMAKALGIAALKTWLAAGGMFEVHGWGKVGPRGKRKCWQCTRRAVTLIDMSQPVA